MLILGGGFAGTSVATALIRRVTSRLLIHVIHKFTNSEACVQQSIHLGQKKL